MGQDADPGYRDLDLSQGFDRIIESLDHFQAASYMQSARRELYRLLRPAPGKRILDAGCGTGIDAAALAAKVQPGGEVVGLDRSEKVLAIARERHGRQPGLCFEAGSIETLPFPDSCFDAAFAIRTVQYVADPLAGIRELARVTKPGGRVAVAEGGMAAVDLPDGEITRRVFGPRAGLGVHLPVLMREAGLRRIVVKSGFGYELGTPDPLVLEYAGSMAESLVAEGVVSREDAGAWLAEVQRRATDGSWFAADSVFVVCGQTG